MVFLYYSPSPEYAAACCRDEWRGDPPKLEERRRVGFGEFRFDTPQPACWNAAKIPFTELRGASLMRLYKKFELATSAGSWNMYLNLL